MNSSSESSLAGAKRLLRRLARQTFLAMRKTQALTFSGLRNWSALVRAFEYFQQCFLGHFFGVLTLPAHEPAILKNPGAEIVDKAVEGVRFPPN